MRYQLPSSKFGLEANFSPSSSKGVCPFCAPRLSPNLEGLSRDACALGPVLGDIP